MDIINLTFYANKKREFPEVSSLRTAFSGLYKQDDQTRDLVLDYFKDFFDPIADQIPAKVISSGINSKYYFLMWRDYGNEIRVLISPIRGYLTIEDYISTANYQLREISATLKGKSLCGYYSVRCDINMGDYRPIKLRYERRRRVLPKKMLGASGILILLNSYVSFLIANVLPLPDSQQMFYEHIELKMLIYRAIFGVLLAFTVLSFFWL